MVDIASGTHIVGDGAGRDNTKYFFDRWSSDIFRELRADLYFMELVSEVPSDKITGGTYHQPKVGKLGGRNFVPGTPATLQSYIEDEFTMVFKRHREASFMIFNIHDLFDDSNPGLKAEYTREIVSWHMFDIDRWIQGERAVIQKAGNHVTAVDSGGANAPLNRGAVVGAKLTADKLFMPQKDRRWLFAPDQLASLYAVPEFNSGDYVSGSPTMTGEIGTLYGSPVIINNNILKNINDAFSLVTGESSGSRVTTAYPAPGFVHDPSGTPDYGIYWPDAGDTGDSNGAGQETLAATDSLPINAYTGMLVHKEWLKFGWAQQPKIESDYEVVYQGSPTVSTAIYDSKVYRPEFCVLIHSYETT